MSPRSETRIPIRIYNTMASILEGNSPPQFHPDQLMETAAKHYGGADFGDDSFLEGLRMLCDSLNTDSELHPYGRAAVKTSLLCILRNRLELESRWKEQPQVLKSPVEKPVFIVGPPRTGTTLLFNLLALDDRFRFILSWEAARPGLQSSDKKNIKKAMADGKRYISFMNYVRPDLKKIHHLAPEKPEECIPLLANSFESGSFAFTFNTKSYLDWYAEQDHRYCYSYYRKQLQWIQSQKAGNRWLLKSPAHLPAFTTLFETFPDALILQTHRDPEMVIPSITNLEYVFQSMVSYEIDKKEIGEYAVDYLVDTMKSALASRDVNHSNVFDIQYEELFEHPIGVLEQVYRYMGESLTAGMKERADNYLIRNPKNKFGKHQYSLEEIGLKKKTIHEKFEFYYDRFNFTAK